jgi:hypothetical protein
MAALHFKPRRRNRLCKRNPLEAADLAAYFTEPYGTAGDVVDIGAGTTSDLCNKATGDGENANAGWMQAGTGGAAVLVPFASGAADATPRLHEYVALACYFLSIYTQYLGLFTASDEDAFNFRSICK